MTDRRSTAAVLAGLLGVAALALGGCGGSAATPPIVYVTPAPTPSPLVIYVTPTPAITTPPAPTIPPEAGASWPATPTVVDTIQSEGGSTAKCTTWIVTVHKPVVSGIPAAGAMNAAIATLVDGYVADFKAKLDQGSGAGPCTLDGKFTVGAASQALVTILFENAVSLGGVTVTATAGSVNFAAPTGSTLAFGDLFTDSSAAAELLSKQARTLLATSLSTDSDKASIEAGTGPSIDNFGKAWILRPEGLGLTFAQNQVGPAAAGTPSITVPWAAISGVLNPSGPAAQFIVAPGSSPSST
jgi:hypothetical protein